MKSLLTTKSSLTDKSLVPNKHLTEMLYLNNLWLVKSPSSNLFQDQMKSKLVSENFNGKCLSPLKSLGISFLGSIVWF